MFLEKCFLSKKIVVGCFVFLGCVLRAEISSNKFDVQGIGSAKGIAGQNGFGEKNGQKSYLDVNFSASPIFNNGASSWVSNGTKSSSYSRPGNAGNYEYGILEENGFWNADGIFYGFTDNTFSRSKVELPVEKVNNLGSGVSTYSTFLYYAPEGFSFSNLTTEAERTSWIGRGLGKLPDKSLALVGGKDAWTSSKYQNYYQAFLKSLDITDIQPLGNIDDPSREDWTSSRTAPTFTVPESLNKEFVPDNYAFDPISKTKGLMLLNPTISKNGCRFAANVSPYPGITVNAKLGLVDLSVKNSVLEPAAGAPSKLASNLALLEAALADLGATIKEYRHRGLEDAYFSLTAGQGFAVKDEDGDVVLNLYPFVIGGVFAPTSKKYSEAEGDKYLFYIPLGNEGHTGYSVTAGFAADFKDMLCLTFAGGATIFDTISIKNYRMPNHKDQVGFYPFKIDISRKKGTVYYGYISLKSVNCEEGLNFYGDILYTSHKKDLISLHDASLDRNAAFADGRIKAESLSAWNLLEFNAGLVYTMSNMLQFGASLTSNISGNSVPRMRTICLTSSFVF